MNITYLGKKRNKNKDDKIIKNNENNDSDSIEQYQNIFNTKIKILNKNVKKSKNDIENQKLIFKKNNNKINSENNDEIILPKPKYELIDKSSKLFLNSNDFETKYSNLINPDNIRLIKIEEEKKNFKKININNNENKKNLEDNKILEINQNSLLDKNWEENYLNYLNKKELNNKKSYNNEENDNNNDENNLQNIIDNYKKEKDDLKEKNNKNKKISMKKK